MKKYRKVLLIISLVILCLVVTLILLYRSLISPVSHDATEKEVVIAKGLSTSGIGSVLKENNLIKNDKFFVFYVKLNKVKGLKAGTYKLKESMSLKEIVKILEDGNIINNEEITITFKEGINFRELAKVIANNTNNTENDVFDTLKDENYLKSLIEDYWFITDDILDKKIYYPLEGYLFPDTYKFVDKNISVTEIFKKLLDQMSIVLEPYKAKIEMNNRNVHEILTLASIAEKEVSLASDRKNVISVFNNRIKNNMNLGSDITARYGVKLDDPRPLKQSEYDNNNAYNTRRAEFKGLPAGPIAMVSKDSLDAAINQVETDYLYFISNIQTKETFFFKTDIEFEAKKKELANVNAGY